MNNFLNALTAVSTLLMTIFILMTLYFQFRALVYPSRVVSRYDEAYKKYIINVTIENKGNNLGKVWINFVLLSSKEESLENIVQNTAKIIPISIKKRMFEIYPQDKITSDIVIDESTHKGNMDKTFDHVHLLIMCESSFLKFPLKVEKVYYWDKSKVFEFVEQARNHFKYKPVFDHWFKILRNSPK